MKQEIEEQKEVKTEIKQESEDRTEKWLFKKSPFEINGNIEGNGMIIFWLAVNYEYLKDTRFIYTEVQRNLK